MKTLYRVLLVPFLLLLLAACSDGSGKESSSDKGQTGEKAELMISAAASLTDALNEIKSTYEDEHQVSLTFNFGSSGKLATQIESGAPSDVFLSASKKDMDSMEEKELIDEETRVDFTKNVIVLIANEDSDSTISSFDEIEPAEVTHFAVGEPESVPVGRYTKEAFENLGIWDDLQSKLVMGSDVRQVLTHVEMGNADFGVVYSSDALISDKVKVLAEADPSLHAPIVYPGAVVSDSKYKKQAQEFLDYLTSSEGKEVLQKYGFK